MRDYEIRLTTLLGIIFGAIGVGLLVGAWWMPYLGWLAILCGQVVLFMLLAGEHERTRRLSRALAQQVQRDSGNGARPLR